jgi:hypothetical protein
MDTRCLLILSRSSEVNEERGLILRVLSKDTLQCVYFLLAHKGSGSASIHINEGMS